MNAIPRLSPDGFLLSIALLSTLLGTVAGVKVEVEISLNRYTVMVIKVGMSAVIKRCLFHLFYSQRQRHVSRMNFHHTKSVSYILSH